MLKLFLYTYACYFNPGLVERLLFPNQIVAVSRFKFALKIIVPLHGSGQIFAENGKIESK